jgi:hypothetical protein
MRTCLALVLCGLANMGNLYADVVSDSATIFMSVTLQEEFPRDLVSLMEESALLEEPIDCQAHDFYADSPSANPMTISLCDTTLVSAVTTDPGQSSQTVVLVAPL